jgi:Coenzyme PQQ synthesis protein D (PqqD)
MTPGEEASAMVSLGVRLDPNKSDVAAKVMDGEAIAINLATGTYYSMDGAGAEIWTLIEQGLSLERIAAAVAARYEVSVEQARADVLRLGAELIQEGLVVVSDTPPVSAAAAVSDAGPRHPYRPLSLDVYRDMAELLALDPPVPGVFDHLWTDPPEDSSSASPD